MTTNTIKPENMAFATRLDEAIRAKGLSNADVSARMGNGSDPFGTRIANWRAGRNLPNGENLARLMEALDLPLDELHGLLSPKSALTYGRGRRHKAAVDDEAVMRRRELARQNYAEHKARLLADATDERTEEIGPARTAVALARAAAANPHARVNGVSTAGGGGGGNADVFGFAMRGDGSTVIRLHAVMPPGQHERAVALIQQLLAFGLVKTEG